MKYYYIILIVVGSLIFLHFALAWFIFSRGFYMSKRRRLKFHESCEKPSNIDIYLEGQNWRKEQKLEDIYIKSFDNLKLHAELREVENPEGIIVFFHGFFGSNIGRNGRISKDILKTRNVNFLYVDHRSFHLSEGHYSTLGYKEKDDVKTWVEYVNKRYPNLPIILIGYSFGAGTVLLSSYQELLNVKLIIADSGYNDAYDMFKLKLAKTIKFDSKLLCDTINLYARIFGHFNMKKTNIEESLKTNENIPILYIHGTCDDYVPCSNSTFNANATKTKHEIIIYEGATHVRSYDHEPERYIQMLNKYFDEYLKK